MSKFTDMLRGAFKTVVSDYVEEFKGIKEGIKNEIKNGPTGRPPLTEEDQESDPTSESYKPECH